MATTTKPGRVPCEVLGCGRTAPAEPDNPTLRIICGKCWRIAPLADRKAYSKAYKEVTLIDDRLEAAMNRGDEEAEHAEDIYARGYAAEVADLAWNRILRFINEARAGI